MEPSLSAREFLQRFHLPQLVRLSPSVPTGTDDWPEAALTCGGNGGPDQVESPASSRSSTSISSSFVALANERRAPPPVDGNDRDDDDDDTWTYRAGCSATAAAQSPERSGFRSLVGLADERPAEGVARFHSISGCVPELVARRAAPVPAKPAEATGESIRLLPQSKRLNTSKLQLEQPFLLYKAFKKYDVCAYMVDLKNELTDKSGDPIYFPQNYPGWFSMAPQSSGAYESTTSSAPLATIDEVCRSSAQVFLTRDELVGFRLPSKLSHLTKLKNNQLLALPLAINLDKINYENGTNGGGSSSHHKSQSSKSGGDIQQVVIQCGQTLKIRGVYEDVLPLFEGKQQHQLDFKQQHQHNRHHHHHHHRQSYVAPSYHSYEQQQHSITTRQMAPQAAPVYHQLGRNGAGSNAAHLYSAQNGYGHLQVNNNFNNNNNIGKRGRQANQVHSAFIYAPHSQVLQPAAGLAGKSAKSSAKLARQDNSSSSGSRSLAGVSGGFTGGGQRYARCVLLNQSSVDRLTNCSSATTQQQQVVGMNGEINGTPETEAEEVEVLIPIEQRGRFYLCATNQSIVSELYCHGCHQQQQSSAAAGYSSGVGTSSPALVFRLSQIITLLSLSQRLAASRRSHPHQQAPANSQVELPPAPIRLPLSVQLVIGPRPANFSPSMFGSSSNMESYFRLESHVGGHSMGCSFNRNFVYTAAQVQSSRAGGYERQPACACALRLSSDSSNSFRYGLFSGRLRIERVAKRDVLLACTIKRDPLLHLNLASADNSSTLTAANQQPGSRNSSDSTGSASSRRASSLWLSDRPSHTSKYLLESSGESSDLGCNLRPTSSQKRISLQQQQYQQLHSSKLLALREDNNRHLTTTAGGSSAKKSDQLQFAAAAKSSFSRLRVCRSLISLNGRRKRRPTIPKSMMAANGAASAGRKSGELPPGGANGDLDGWQQDGNGDAGDGGVDGGDSQISMVEFDCDSSELRFVRTFVESSIPTSNIPDLVLNRMEFCQRNSAVWERQLKLSYTALSRDFDLCQRQLSLAAARRGGGGGDVDEGGQPQSIRARHARSVASFQAEVASAAAVAANSTASSRSSSGVSSSGERAAATAGSSLGSASQYRPSLSATDSLTSGTSGSATGAMPPPQQPLQPNRLLRLVQRILPFGGSTRQVQSAAADAKAVRELGRKFRRDLLTADGNGSCSSIATNNVTLTIDDAAQSTLMNAQKIHRKLMTGSVRQLATAISKDDEPPGAEEEEETEDSSGSHLYESLERLNEGLRKSRLAPGKGVAPGGGGEQVARSQQVTGAIKSPRSLPSRSGVARLGLGKSIEFLCGGANGRRTALLSTRNNSEGFGTDDDDDDREHFDYLNDRRRRVGEHHEDEDDEDDDDWWRSSTHESHLTTPEPLLSAAARNHGVAQVSADRRRSLLVDKATGGCARRKAANSTTATKAAALDANYLMEPVSIEACTDDQFVSAVEDELLPPYLSAGCESELGSQTYEDNDDEEEEEESRQVDEESLCCRSERAHIEEPNDVDVDASDSEHIYVNLQSRSSFHLAATAQQRRQVSRMERKLQRIRARRQWTSAAAATTTGAVQQQQERLASQWSGSGKQLELRSASPTCYDGSQQQQQQQQQYRRQQLLRRRRGQVVSNKTVESQQQQQQQQQPVRQQRSEMASRSSLADESVNSSASLCSSSGELVDPPGGVRSTLVSAGETAVAGNTNKSVSGSTKLNGAVLRNSSSSSRSSNNININSLRSSSSSSSTCSSELSSATNTTSSSDANWTHTHRQVSLRQRAQVGQVTMPGGGGGVAIRAANSLEAWPLATLDRPC